MKKIQFKKVHKIFKSEKDSLETLKNINLSVDSGEFISIIGPSGCGKSTLFHILTGLIDEYEGEIFIDGVLLAKSDKLMSYMHQKDLLMPWRNLLSNVMLPLELQGINQNDAEKKVKELLSTFGLEGFENAYPDELSGGMRQRAALLRTFMVESDILLLDEPFASLDAISRHKMQSFLLEIWQKFKGTVLFITHDIEEAIYLSDKIFVLSNRPAEVLEVVDINIKRPRNRELLLEKEFIDIKGKLIKSLES